MKEKGREVVEKKRQTVRDGATHTEGNGCVINKDTKRG